MTTTAEICIKHGIPIPASVWKRAGIEVPKYQTAASGRTVETEPGKLVAAAVEANDETPEPETKTRSPFGPAYVPEGEIETEIVHRGLSFDTHRVKNPVFAPVIDISVTPSKNSDIMPEKPKNWYEQ